MSIPGGVETINRNTFEADIKLETIYVPVSVTNIGKSAFSRCKSLKTVYYAGSEEQWAEIVIGDDNEPLLSAEIIFNYHNCESSAARTEGYQPTCTEDGITDGFVCEVCGKTIVEQIVIEALGHKVEEWIVDKEATETEEGLRHGVCVNCGEEIEEIIPVIRKTFFVTVNGEKTEYEAGASVKIELPVMTYSAEAGKWFVYTDWKAEGVEASFVKGAVEFTMPENDVVISSNSFMHGDANKDNKITALDVLALLKALKSAVIDDRFDVNLDGKVTALDKLALYKVLKGAYDYSKYQ